MFQKLLLRNLKPNLFRMPIRYVGLDINNKSKEWARPVPKPKPLEYLENIESHQLL